MIKELSIQNVRLFSDEMWTFPFAPLTVLCGSNSTGKSSVLKTLLLLTQSLGVGSEPSEGRLRFSGEVTDLGTFRSFVSHNEQLRDITVKLVISDEISEKYIQFLRALNRGDRLPSIQRTKDRVQYQLSATLTFGLAERGDQLPLPVPGAPTVTGSRLRRSTTDRAVLKESRFSFSCEKAELLAWELNIREGESGFAYDLVMPSKFFQTVSGGKLDVQGDTATIKMEATMQGFLPIGVRARLKPKTEQPKKKPKANQQKKHSSDVASDWSFWPLPPVIQDATNDLRLLLTKIFYLAPLRSQAKRYYIVNVDTAPEFDPRGEFLPYLIRDHADTQVINPHPGPPMAVREEPLKRALNLWIYYLRTGKLAPDELLDSELSISTAHDVLLECRLRGFDPKESHALADSGFGYSQVLPILVRGLLAPYNSVLIVEQPELHLNPSLQVRLADFFVMMAVAGKQWILETHSEHIVNAIRVLTAEDESRLVSKLSSILFLENRDGRPRVRPLNVLPDGTVPQWPREFFGEAMDLSTRLLKAQRKSAKHSGPN